MKFLPKSWAGGLSVILTVISLISVIIFFIAMLFGQVDFNSRIWDVTICICVIAELLALILSMTALIKFADKRTSVQISLVLSSLVISFVLIHSIFIKS